MPTASGSVQSDAVKTIISARGSSFLIKIWGIFYPHSGYHKIGAGSAPRNGALLNAPGGLTERGALSFFNGLNAIVSAVPFFRLKENERGERGVQR